MGRVVALSLLVLVAVPAVSGCAVLSKRDTWDLDVTLGLLLGETGGYALTDLGDAVEIAQRQMKSAGYGLEIRLLRAEAGNDPGAAFDRLVKDGAAAVIAGVHPDDAQALAARASAQKRPLLLATPAGAALSGDVSYTIQVAQDARAVGRALAALAAREGVTRPILFHPADPFVALMSQAFTAAWNGTAPGEIVHRIASQADVTGQARSACGGEGDGLIVLSLPDETGWAARALTDGACRERMRVVAAPTARGPALLTEAGEDAAERPIAAGVIGVQALRSRMDAFRSLFEAETGRLPGPYANEAYDAAIYVVLASFASKGNPESDPAKATIRAADLQAHLLPVASAPGIQHQELSSALDAAQAGDELDWPGYAHDDAFTERRQPAAASFGVWRVSPNGGFENAGSVAP